VTRLDALERVAKAARECRNCFYGRGASGMALYWTALGEALAALDAAPVEPEPALAPQEASPAPVSNLEGLGRQNQPAVEWPGSCRCASCVPREERDDGRP
jgi:hypothetical protein